MTTPIDTYAAIGSSIADSYAHQMNGWPCFKIGKTAFISFEKNAMIFKLPQYVIAELLLLDNAYVFNPNNKTPMNSWICLPFTHQALWPIYAQLAANFILSKNKTL
jgi:hypothetical protein